MIQTIILTVLGVIFAGFFVSFWLVLAWTSDTKLLEKARLLQQKFDENGRLILVLPKSSFLGRWSDIPLRVAYNIEYVEDVEKQK